MQEQEKEQVKAFLVKMAVDKLNITEKQAGLRIEAILASGIMEILGTPETMQFQIGIDVAMRIPQPEEVNTIKEKELLLWEEIKGFLKSVNNDEYSMGDAFESLEDFYEKLETINN